MLLSWRPLSAWWNEARGNRALLRGDARGALHSFDRALRLEPSWGLAHEDRGRALMALDDPRAALAEFDQAACGAACAAESGDALARLGQAQAAIDRYTSAKAVGRVNAIALGLSHSAKFDEAFRLENALIARLHDDFLERADLASAYETLGNIHLEAAIAQPAHAREHEKAAIAAYARASHLAPLNEGYLLSYGFAQARFGDPLAARRALERVLELHPHQHDAESGLAALPSAPPQSPAAVGP